MVSYSIDDFILFPSHEAYPVVQGHQETRQEDIYSGHQYTMNDQFIDLAMTTYDSCAPVAVLSSAPATLYNAPQFIVDAPQDNLKHDSYRYTPPRSPSNSATHSFDPPPSTMSSTSGASIQSANSSAVGSPYSRSNHIVPSQEHWAETHHGLGIAPGMLSQESFYPSDYVTRSLDQEVIFAQEKLPSDFVGKSRKVSSSQGPMGSAPLSSSLSDSFRHTFTPSLAVNTSVPGSNTTIDAILEEVNSQVSTPKVESSPDSAHLVITPVDLPRARTRRSSPSTSEVFMSPSTPASATPSRTRSPAVARRVVSRSQSVVDAGVNKVKSSPRASRSHLPYGRPTPPPASPTIVSVGQFQTPFFSQSSGNFVAPLESSYPSLIQPFQTPITHNTTTAPYPGVIHAFHTPTPMFQPPSPAPSNSSVPSQNRSASAGLKARSQSPYHHPSPFQPYTVPSASRRLSISSEHSRYSLGSHRSSSFEVDEENAEKGRCPKADCGRVFKDLKAHMLTHQLERPEKCPITTCDYHQKGFARKYDKNRHTLTHYKGTMVCGFCPGSGSAAEKSFNRADVFKRHLTTVHGVEQAPPNSRKRVPNSGAPKKLTGYPPDATGKCSTCSDTFSNAQDFYEHLDDCVLRIVRQEEPSEAINAQRLAEVANDPAVQETLDRHMLHNGLDSGTQSSAFLDEEDDQDEDEDDNNNEAEDSFVDPPKFDLDAYIANYKGKTRFDRLLLIGRSSSYLYHEALKAAIAEAKQGKDVGRYELALETLRQIAPDDPDATPDLGWVDKTMKQVKVETDRLEQELKGYKNNLIKESIRMGNEDLGSHYHQIGDLGAATKAYGRMRDYCTTPAHIASMCFKIIHVSIEQGNWMAVQSNVLKIRNLAQRDDDMKRYQPRLAAAMGLAQLASGNYKEAAHSFLSTDPRLVTEEYNEILTANDVAVYGGLCALASMDRHELQTHVLDNASFRNFLELEPHVRRAVALFAASKYGACLAVLDAYRPDYGLDLHLQRHVPDLYAAVRAKSIVQYCIPFSCVTLEAMAAAFGTSAGAIAAELVDMIERGSLEARVDAQKGVLVAKRTNAREVVHEEALNMAREYERTAQLRLWRVNVVNAGLEVKAPRNQAREQAPFGDVFMGHSGGMAGGMGMGMGSGAMLGKGGGGRFGGQRF